MSLVLRLYEDALSAGETLALSAQPRAIFVAAGDIQIGGETVQADNGLVRLEALSIRAGNAGACLWRWEVAEASRAPEMAAVHSYLKIAPAIFDHDVTNTHLLRLDSVAFPPGGCAYLHTHQGPGIRCLIEGRIRIDAEGHSIAYGPGSPWFEAGPEPVFAQADANIPTRFIRVSVLPNALAGKSSIRYVREEDRDKPKSQTYRVFDEKLLAG